MKTATYTGTDGKPFTVEYDDSAPCISCGQPVKEASMGGTVVCPWCDCGRYRDGTEWTFMDSISKEIRFQKAKEIAERKTV